MNGAWIATWLRLMIVEDDEPLVELLRCNFEAVGHAVETIMHGDEAEAHLAKP